MPTAHPSFSESIQELIQNYDKRSGLLTHKSLNDYFCIPKNYSKLVDFYEAVFNYMFLPKDDFSLIIGFETGMILIKNNSVTRRISLIENPNLLDKINNMAESVLLFNLEIVRREDHHLVPAKKEDLGFLDQIEI